MQETVIEPSGVTSGIYAVPLPEDFRDRAATAHDRVGRPAVGKWHELACMGAGGGLWTTASDLARFAIEIMLVHAGQSDKIISRDTLDLMLTHQIEDEVNGIRPILGVGLVGFGEGRDFLLWAGGSNPPGFRSLLVWYPERGQGVAIMTNGANGFNLINEILNSIAIEYGWPGSGG